jgi:hypothetical protein
MSRLVRPSRPAVAASDIAKVGLWGRASADSRGAGYGCIVEGGHGGRERPDLEEPRCRIELGIAFHDRQPTGEPLRT